jgi:DNA adenine methylase
VAIARGASRLDPFLKWAGGKRQLLPVLRRCYPREFGSYFEPFLGSGVVFFDLAGSGRLEGRSVALSDRSPDLIGCYRAVRADVDGVIAALRVLAEGHAADARDHYYRVRDERFNRVRRQALDAARPLEDAYTPTLAAALIYLNRTGFNGLFRLNGRGGFNVPLGRYVRPRICDEPTLRAAAAALASPAVDIRLETFEGLEARAARGDFIYLDPPYAPLSPTSTFTSYTAAGFDAADQARLQTVVFALADRGCHIVLSNSTAPEIARLYDTRTARRLGLRADKVPARRAINSRASARGEVLEYLITNVPSQPLG